MSIERPTGPSSSPFAGRIGIARTEITPPIGVYFRNWGAAPHDAAESVHRPLTLGAMTFSGSTNSPRLVLMEADLCTWPTFTYWYELRRRILDRFDLDESQFIFSLAHTHAGPRVMEPDPAWQGSELLRAWLDDFLDAAVELVARAAASSSDSLLEWRVGRCRLASQRDFCDPSPTSNRRLCGYNPDGQADDALVVGRISDSTGNLRGVIVNYACHPTTLAWENRALSPDYVGAMRETVADGSSGALVFFLQGASGDLAPRYQYVGDTAVADRHGRQLGYAVRATLEDMEPPGMRLVYDGIVESGAPLAVWRYQPIQPETTLTSRCTTVELVLQDLPTTAQLEKLMQDCSDRMLQERLRRKRDVRKKLGEGSTFHLPVYAWRLGQAILVGTMTEAYSCFQTELRRKLPDCHVICMNLINGSIGYLPPAELYESDVYQVWQSPFAQGSLERMIAAAEELIRQLLDEADAQCPNQM